jgi:uncharacterized protein
MVIHEMSREECLRVLAGARLARLACAHENQPYVVPVYLAYHAPPVGEACLYGLTTDGLKVEWMRANPLVCVEVDEVAADDQWVSVITLGRYEELPGTPDWQPEPRPPSVALGRSDKLPGASEPDGQRLLAYQVLQARAMWWEPACAARAARTHDDPAKPIVPVYYRVRIDRVTGHRATPDPGTVAEPARAADDVPKKGWLRSVLRLRRSPTDDGPALEVLLRRLYASRRIGRPQADLLILLHNRMRHLTPAFERFFYRAIKDHILADGRIDAEEAAWLRRMICADGKLDDEERKFLHELKNEAEQISQTFEQLYEETMKLSPEQRTSG